MIATQNTFEKRINTKDWYRTTIAAYFISSVTANRSDASEIPVVMFSVLFIISISLKTS